MLHTHRALPCIALAVAMSLVPPPLSGQVVRGTVRVAATSLPLDLAQVVARDSAGTRFAAQTTDSTGTFRFRIPPGRPLTIEVRRLGFSMGNTLLRALVPSDTADLEFLMTEVAAAAEAVTVTAAPGINDTRLDEAERRGWRVLGPELVLARRENAQDFFQLMRSLGSPGVLLPRSLNDCIRSIRNNQCMTYIIDGQIVGPTAQVLPSDVYFIALLSQSQSAVQFGDRAPWGAVYIITRSSRDRVQPNRPRRPPPGSPPASAPDGRRPPAASGRPPD